MTGRLLAAALFCVAMFAPAANAQMATHRAQAVVELYTSQGCFQCTRANRVIGTFSEESDVLALTFPVTIWDYLGWRDTFAFPEYTLRQRAYTRALHTRRFTPQLIFNGDLQTSGSNWDEARAVLNQAKARGLSDGPDIAITRPLSNRLRITLGSGARRPPADVWLIAFDPGPVLAYVTDGANDNRRVYHYNLARRMEDIGEWTGEPLYFERSRCQPECAVIVQERSGGRILSAAFTSNSRR